MADSIAAAPDREEPIAAHSPTGDAQRDHSSDDYARVAFPPPDTGERTADEAQIRARAYELYIERGFAEGDELDDWLRAERDVRSRSSSIRPEADRSPPAP